MTSEEAVANFLKKKRIEACRFIELLPTLQRTEEALVATAMQNGAVTVPSLGMRKEERESKSISEVPSRDDIPSSLRVGVTVGAPYEGVYITIPIHGSRELFGVFVNGRYICDGFYLGGSDIKIKQFDFYRTGVEGIKNTIKDAIDALIAGLEGLKPLVELHKAELHKDALAAVAKRKKEIADKEQRDKDADPWG
jgi:hypothetical protein